MPAASPSGSPSASLAASGRVTPEAQLTLSRLFEAMMHRLHDSRQQPLDQLNDDDTRAFISAHAAILDSSFDQVAMSSAMRQSLREADYVFSGLKTFHELNEAFPSLIGEDGNRKPFHQFLDDVQNIDQTYNRNYLRAEYNFAHASAAMAARWEQDSDDEGGRYLLQYRTALDGNVRPEHAALHGVTLPPSDPFWQSYYPPNGWNCRCTAIRVMADKAVPTDPARALQLGEQATARDRRGMFRYNPGQQRTTFPRYNPYTTSRCRNCPGPDDSARLAFQPGNELCQACRIVRQCYGDLKKSESAVMRKHYLTEMEPLKQKKVTVDGNGHPMSVGFRQYGNKHLYADAYKGKIDMEELKTLDRMLQSATFVTKASLSKPRPNDDIKRFYYYRTVNRNGKEIFLNVAETDYVRPNGKLYHDRYLYSITKQIKK